MRRLLVVTLLATAACARARVEDHLPQLPFATDSVYSQRVSDGVMRWYIHSPTGPWGISVLQIDLDRCNRAVAVKGGDSAAGRTKTTALLGDRSKREHVVGGVNADFFSLKDGTPVGLLVVDGRMITPPGKQSVLAVDSAGVPHIDFFKQSGTTLLPFYPLEAVGGRPRIVQDSAIAPEVDTFGQASFSVGRNPRTAAGIARDGRRLILAVIDGRQKPYSDGMSLRETATLMLALGARDAINLDGGGSSTLVYADPDASGALRIANRPSDKGGERAVGDALAIVDRCQRD
jgi:Exopolysaccharide biosynthesis protein related to N-acetylglucosamine-1-phosphodiester alpha-N-acetylglucosaminidase